MADDRLIVALDFHDIDDVVALVAELGDSVSFYKVGMELFYSAGAEVVPKLIAVTILTSINEEDWAGLGMQCTIREQVVRLAKLAKSAGMDGVVASPQEAAAIREACGPGFMIVTPGVRPAGASVDDQSRIATPAAALENGASHLVIGRPIRAAENPKAAAEMILKEMECVK